LQAITGGRPGKFVEIGALDGITYSNTLMYEKCLGWDGLLIEGNPDSARKLLQSGRLNSKFEASAICKGAGFVPMTKGGGAVAGEVDTMSQQEQTKYAGRKDFNLTVQVPCREMRAIMDDALLPSSSDALTFLSLDVEGAELKVLGTFDPARFSLIMVEVLPDADGRLSGALKSMDAHMRAAGMTRVTRGPLQVVGPFNYVYATPNARARFADRRLQY